MGCSDYMIQSKVLELGCGNKPIFRKSVKVDKFDFGNNIVHDLEEGLPVFSNKFQNVFAMQLFQHVKNIDVLLSDIYKVLEDDGELVFSITNVTCLMNRFKLLFGKVPQDFYNLINPNIPYSTNHLFTLNSVRKLFGEHNFFIFKVESGNFLPSRYSNTFTVYAKKFI
jgi:cyclopropane fatty-acyl-phospholipid synthase-like methyltransferase